MLKAIATKDKLKANRIIQYFEKNPKSNPIQATLPVLFNYFSNLLICYYSKDRSENGLMQELGFKTNFQLKRLYFGHEKLSCNESFNLISEIRICDARSKGIENSSASDGDILKELLFKILH